MRRPNWRRDVDVKVAPPTKILGGYNFPKALWLQCGLASCHALHGAGYLTLLADGTETHIGSYCGRTHLGAAWQEMESKFQAARKTEAQFDAIKGVLDRRNELLQKAKNLRERCSAASSSVSEIESQLARDRAIQRAMSEIVKLGGKLSFTRSPTEAERAYNRAQRFVLVQLGRIDGAAALGKSNLVDALKASVIDHLEAFDMSHLLKLKGKELDRHAKFIGNMESTIRRAEYYLRDSARLLQASNWEAFENYCRDSGMVRFGDKGPEVFSELRRIAAKPVTWLT